MYVRPGNSWDLQSCRQQPGESLRENIRQFSKQRTELPNITDSDAIGAFLAGTTCRDLVSKLGRKTPTKASELMDIATKFASGQEAVEAIFQKDKQPQGRQQEDVPEASAQRGTKKKAKKKSQAKRDAADRVPSSTPLRNASCFGATSIKPGPRREMAKAKTTTRRRATRQRSSPRSTAVS
jgi:hypothetical protein